jgi:hypothetical protein
MHKLSHLRDGQWVAHSFRPSYTLPEESAHTQCLRSAVPSGDSVVFERLVATLQAPYILLYVLHTPRGEGEPGRYQSPELSRNELDAFISQFGAYLSADARFDLWAYSPKEQATVVWDRHNQLFAYGPVERFVSELRVLGFEEGEVEVPVPHQHHYRPECDALAKALLGAQPWSFSPLRPEDEQ